MVWQPGNLLQDGKYTIKKQIYQGGFGVTYLAKDRSGNKVVIKTLNENCRNSRDFAKLQQDFMNEVLCLAKCNHPHIVRVEEFILEDSHWCVVMEYIEGVNLGNWIKKEGALSEVEALKYIRQIAEAVNWVHHQGFLHRDIKPLNIMIRENPKEAILIDFGIAREFTQDLTQVHTEYVSKGFAPIEQYDRRSKRGTYTDVYGLAATLYAMVTGKIPEAATLRDRSLTKYQKDSLVLPQEINPKLSNLINNAILKGMAIEPEDRPISVLDWLNILEKNIETQENKASKKISNHWISAVGIDYNKLSDLLSQGKWQEADQETTQIVALVLKEEPTHKFRIEEIKNFPCRDLRTLDQLWVKYSEGRFGFSVQNRIWRQVSKDYEKFGDRIGWSQGKSWLPYSQLTFDLSAPAGHLPSWGRRGRFWSFLATKIQKCGL